jgi:hypothetical protein
MWKGSIVVSFVLLNISVRLYTISRRKGSLLLFDQSYEKGNRIQDKKASSSQKSIVHIVSLVVDGGDDAE